MSTTQLETQKNEFITKYISKEEPVGWDNIQGDIFHQNYVYYLQECWDKHLGVIIDPTFLWHMVLGEMAVAIKDFPDIFRQYLTKQKEGKTVIEIYTAAFDVDYFVDEVIKELYKLIPIPLDDGIILPDFSTHTGSSRFTHKIAFMDAVSPYYDYWMLACNIPEVKVLGTDTDWEMFGNSLEVLYNLLPVKIIRVYFDRVKKLITNIRDNKNDQDFLKGIFKLERCGSGSEQEVSGWILDMYLKNWPSKIQNYSTHTSMMEFKFKNWKNSDFSEEKYHIYAGLFSSIKEDNFLVPQFGSILAKKGNEQEKPKSTTFSDNKFNIFDESDKTIILEELIVEGFKVNAKLRDLGVKEETKGIPIGGFKVLKVPRTKEEQDKLEKDLSITNISPFKKEEVNFKRIKANARLRELK